MWWERLNKAAILITISTALSSFVLWLFSPEVRFRVAEFVTTLRKPVQFQLPIFSLIVVSLMILFLIGLHFHPFSQWRFFSRPKSSRDVIKDWRVNSNLHIDGKYLQADAGEQLRDGAWKISIKEAGGKGIYGPYIKLQPGKYCASFRIKIDKQSDLREHLADLDVSVDRAGKNLIKRPITSADFIHSNRYENFDLVFDLDKEAQNVEFRIRTVDGYIGQRYIIVDRVSLIKRSV